ncbi:MAG: 5-formyltetrahydrofolate cyclo-ligase [Omnitrophica bacterium RBG_13_46_9]|nr:MAG: 5-formyltetrahydrofolate cyclo-ligase [Omnitrophica bacterium RBG_13_46_9]
MRKTKGQIRKEILDKLNTQNREEILKKSETIKKKLFSLPEFKRAKFVMFYASQDREVNTEEMIDEAIKMGKKVALPCCSSLKTIVSKEITDRHRDLEKGTYGISEPRKCQKNIQPDKIDLIVVPGIAFDRKNRRIGRGKGYYDRFLGRLSRNKCSVGLAFDFQIVENLPKDSHDIPVSKVITNLTVQTR